MYAMFYVRSSPRPAPNLQTSPPPQAVCTAIARRLPPLPARTSPRTVHTLLATLGSSRRCSISR
eukprot:scaffold54296_cov36-Phaeocystis_antarctica.AAC.2